jgi:hypothetical protein
VSNEVIDQETFVNILNIFDRSREDFIFNPRFKPTEEEYALLEDSDFMFGTGEHISRQPARLRVPAERMVSLWKRSGDLQRSNMFASLVNKKEK